MAKFTKAQSDELNIDNYYYDNGTWHATVVDTAETKKYKLEWSGTAADSKPTILAKIKSEILLKERVVRKTPPAKTKASGSFGNVKIKDA